MSSRRPPEHYLLSYLNSDSGLTRGSSAGLCVPSVTTSLRQGCYGGKRRSGDRRVHVPRGFFPAFYFRSTTVSGRRDVQLPAEDLLRAPSVPFAVEKQRRSRGTVAICIIKQFLPIPVYSESTQPLLPPRGHIKDHLVRASRSIGRRTHLSTSRLASSASGRDISNSSKTGGPP